jgi:uncharacterized membrane protein YccC
MSTWGRLGTAVRTRSPEFRQVTRVTLAVTFAMAISAALHLPHGHWLTITVMLSVRGTYGETITRLFQRVGGTAVGSAIAAILLALAPGQITATLILFVFGMVGFTLRSVNFTYWGLFGTPLAMMLMDFSTPSDWTAAGERIALTVAGGAIALIAARILWPTRYADRLPAQLDQLLSVHADLLRTTAAVVEGELERLPHSQIMAAEQAAEAVSEARKRLGNERVPDTDRIAHLRDAVSSAHRIRDHLIAVGRMSREELMDTGPIPEILDRVADHLEEAAARLEGPPSGTDSALDDEFDDLDAYLSKLARKRRAEIADGVRTDEFTPLRHALLQVSGIRYALRSLRRDANELAQSALAAAMTATAPPHAPQ